ncbi:galactosyltransferase-related protein [Pseudarthrobacter sp. PS3-L1]|uniref:glycosyltransferase family 2 protein n=1 Tax=Pseudarthrobacter sp. PS3-L1 TaxID=3046207 RepID=UPI0024B89A8D|nr:galactosyltransferase-related protein [Pseudarthrobacter sp. PS3-L1]MDJ0318949.1 galactosyltransferase-related protein [Pseudarthrobacter sp. PS3-L1]
MSEFSVLIIVHGRTEHLRRLLAGIDSSTALPAEVVIVYMDEPNPERMACSVPLRIVHVSSLERQAGLPLARARNAAAAAATTENFVFLDVDSIPSTRLFEALIEALVFEDVLVMAEPRYLRAKLGHSEVVVDEQLFEKSVAHHTRVDLPRTTITSKYEMFWSLGFAIRASAFESVEGFDEGYNGYGGEDTDFAFRVREIGIPVRFLLASVFHQHHGVYAPPLNHFTEILSNARRFRERWGVWPMEGWLRAFAERGLISWAPSNSNLVVHRLPKSSEITEVFSTAAY